LEHNIGGYLDEIERGASAFIAGAAALFTAKHGVAQISGALQLGGASRVAVRTIHRRLSERRLRAEASLSGRGFYPQFEYSVLTVSITGSTRKKRVILLTKARGGKIHDKRQLDEEDLVGNIPDEVAIEGDLGFQGLQNEFDNIHLPYKKPKGKELSEQQKQENREFSRQRVACEHAHAGIKRYRSVTDVYRNRVPDFDDHLMLNAAGLWNLYLDAA
jgi:hypothetical protein